MAVAAPEVAGMDGGSRRAVQDSDRGFECVAALPSAGRRESNRVECPTPVCRMLTVMTLPVAVRDVAAASAIAAATAAGIVALTPWSWEVMLPSSLLAGALALIIDIHFFSRPIGNASVAGRRASIALLIVAQVSVLALAFFVGRMTQTRPDTYLFVATSDAPAVGFKALPNDSAEIFPLCQEPGNGVCRLLCRSSGWALVPAKRSRGLVAR
jgi:hypothetical protein